MTNSIQRQTPSRLRGKSNLNLSHVVRSLVMAYLASGGTAVSAYTLPPPLPTYTPLPINYTQLGSDSRIPLGDGPDVTFDTRAEQFLADWACRNDITMMNFNEQGEDFSTVALAELAYQGSCSGDPDQSIAEHQKRIDDVNFMLSKIAPNGQLVGTSLQPGDHHLAHGRKGDLDAALKDLIVIPYLYPSLIRPEAQKALIDTLVL